VVSAALQARRPSARRIAISANMIGALSSAACISMSLYVVPCSLVNKPFIVERQFSALLRFIFTKPISARIVWA
jgi:hypothetical protein